jgi:regulator of nucleoside diphosphate kinase
MQVIPTVSRCSHPCALLGLAVGDELDWPRPGGGVSTVRVTGVVYQPERAGDLHR